jgi:hypothetical protein
VNRGGPYFLARVKGDRVPPPCAKSGTATLPFFGMTDLSLWHHFLSTFTTTL